MSKTRVGTLRESNENLGARVASVASLMAALDAMVVTTALSTIRIDLGASMEALQWTVNAYTLGSISANRCCAWRPVGEAAHVCSGPRPIRRGVRRLRAGNQCWLAHRGAGWAGRWGRTLLMPLAMAVLSAVFPPQERGKALGIFSGVTGVALIAGPAVGGAVAEGLAWQWIFWINVPVGLIAIPLVLSRVPESFRTSGASRPSGPVLVTGAALAIVWGLMRGNQVGWTNAEILASLLTGVVLGVAFVGWELRASEPMVPMRLFYARAFASGIVASFLFYASMYGVVFFLPQFFQAGQGFGPFNFGLRLLPWTATLFVFAPIGGSLVNRLGERPLVVTGLVMQAAGFCWISLTSTPGVAFVARPAADPGRCRRVDGDARRSKRRFERRRNKRGRKGVRHFQHVALSRRDIRCRARRCRLRGERKRRLGAGFQ